MGVMQQAMGAEESCVMAAGAGLGGVLRRGAKLQQKESRRGVGKDGSIKNGFIGRSLVSTGCFKCFIGRRDEKSWYWKMRNGSDGERKGKGVCHDIAFVVSFRCWCRYLGL